MHILAVDTAMGGCSVALLYADNVIAKAQVEEPFKQAEKLVPLIETLLKEQDITYNTLSLITCSIGPGSFTGVRVGLAALKGIALVTHLPVVGVTTLEAMAYKAQQTHHPKQETITVIQDAKRDEVYIQQFSNNEAVSPCNDPSIISINEVINDGQSFVTGNDTRFIDTPPITLYASDIGPLALKREPCEHLVPLYIRKPDAKLPSTLPQCNNS